MRSFAWVVVALATTACFPCLRAAELVLAFTDSQARPLNNVETRLTAFPEPAENTKGAQFRKSDKTGVVRFDSLQPGRYLFQAQRNGYAPLRLTLDLNADTKLPRTLLKTSEFEDLEAQAEQHRQQGRPRECIEVLESLLRSYPEDAVLHNRLAFRYAELPDPERAVAEAEAAAGYDSQFASSAGQVERILLRDSGRSALQARDFPTAIEKFEALTRSDAADPAGYHGLALAYGHTGRYKEALEAIEKAIALDPEDQALQQVRSILTVNSAAQ